MAAGTLTWCRFKDEASQLLRHSDRIKDGWEWTEVEEDQAGGSFLVKKDVIRPVGERVDVKDCVPLEEAEDEDNSDVLGVEYNMEEADTNTVPCELKETEYYRYQYHVLYSTSYSVPVLYFIASRPDGSLASLDEVWSIVPGSFQSRLQDDRWTFLTQQEHPVLGCPMFQLHPCHTATMMQPLMQETQDKDRGSCNYLVSWLSSVGPVVGLNLPLSYAQIGHVT
ncbi:ubiquitin-like-conjugating enzyme ATG10 isoform X1 [Branchiostoma lanceolatum]|uniref:ubiquitin-like-conjugating enzyme ATG10 isoform X1 n=1 Tax=Branchiostoma lanceolatum TaxID=7740 RepID=UPI0034535590